VVLFKGRVFNVKDYELTLGRLLNLNVFQYVNVEYKKIGLDSLQVNIFLTPKLNSGLQFAFEANTSDRSFLGSNISVNFFNDNSLRKAERLSTGVKFGTEFQYTNADFSFSIINLNVDATYEIPRLLTPIQQQLNLIL
jgi:outer membrane protein assembly factor BamA